VLFFAFYRSEKEKNEGTNTVFERQWHLFEKKIAMCRAKYALLGVMNSVIREVYLPVSWRK
jgi:hypothetical protein